MKNIQQMLAKQEVAGGKYVFAREPATQLDINLSHWHELHERGYVLSLDPLQFT